MKQFRFPTTRRVEWGNWGITLYEYESTDPHAAMRKCYGRLNFPCGPQGPIDGFLGGAEHRKYRQICEDWQEQGILPDGLEQLPI